MPEAFAAGSFELDAKVHVLGDFTILGHIEEAGEGQRDGRLGADVPRGRVIVHVRDVDELYGRALAAGLTPDSAPADASWGERYFHITDPDGHELSFAKRL